MKLLIIGIFDEEVIEHFQQQHFLIDYQPRILNEQEIIQRLDATDIIIINCESKVTLKIVQHLPAQFKAFIVLATQAETFFHPDAWQQIQELKIPIYFTPYTNIRAVAEFTIALIFDIVKGITYQNNEVEDGVWNQFQSTQLCGQTLGIIGLGEIGKIVAILGKCIGFNVIYWSRLRNSDIERTYNIEYKDWNELLKISDIISIHLKLTDETYHFINDNELNSIVNGGKTKILVNTARHNLVNVKALYPHLKHKRIKAAFDGWPSEEYAVQIRKRISNEYLIVTPHQAFNSYESMKNASEMAKQCVAAIMDGNQWKHKIN
ncbi:MAG: hypothetical protein JSV76_06955 [Candidatus Bathyarchaeota archaeon]|nr:MAG: hypothetical protein JSV76_06955 [Candidatus Bathyarchaeota archaeon]